MAPPDDATLTDFLRDPNAIVQRLDRNDVVLHRRNAGDLRLSLQSRREADDDGIRFIARLLGHAVGDDVVRMRLASAAAVVPWVSVLSTSEQETFVGEFIKAADAAGELGTMAPVSKVVTQWKATATIRADRAAIVKREPSSAKARNRPPATPGA